MNRRDLFKRLAAAGLVAATADIQRFIPLDRTMLAPKPMFRAGEVIYPEAWEFTGANSFVAGPTYTLKYVDSLSGEFTVVGVSGIELRRMSLGDEITFTTTEGRELTIVGMSFDALAFQAEADDQRMLA